jgi:DedD protein
MAERKAAEDEFNPRHRIVGAVILVALAVVFLPMLLSDRPPDTPPAGAGALPSPETRVAVAPVPLPGDKPAGSGAATADKPADAVRTVVVPVESGAAKPATTPAKPQPSRTVADLIDPPAADSKPAEPRVAKPSVASSKPAVSEKGRWIVQVGVFAQPDNARRLQDKLRHKGYAATLDPPAPGPGKTVRVEVGPYKDQAAARAAATRIQSDFGIKGVVRSD